MKARTRRCRYCKTTRPITAFPKDGMGGRRGRCTPCRERREEEGRTTPPPGAVDVEAGWRRVVRVQVVGDRLLLRVAVRTPAAGGGEGLVAAGHINVALSAAPALAEAVRRVAEDAA